jgi:hypothetical protein
MKDADLAARAAADDMEITVDAMDEIAELEQQLAAERDALSEAELAREKARKASVLKSEIEEARRRRKEEEALAQCEAKYGLLGKNLERVDTIDGMVVVKKPDGIKVRKWQDQYKEDITADALRQIARPCVVYPELSDFDALVTERPVVMVSVATAVLKLAGLRLKELSGK